MKNLTFLLIFALFGTMLSAQTTVTGKITDTNTGNPIPGANVKVVGKTLGTTADFDGNYNLTVAIVAPFSVEVSLIGYENKTFNIQRNGQVVNVSLSEIQTMLNEVVVSASRTPERIMETPVTIERMGIREVRKTASPSYYDGIENLKEVQMNTSSLTFKAINTRGFATVANSRFMQLVDGMDNSSPLLNFVLGNMVGISELDVHSIELLPGASSALYGANAFNGILFMNSKNPFLYQGISAYAKKGITSQEAGGINDFYDVGIRMAHAFNPKFAAKLNFTYMDGTDWFATNYDDRTVVGRTRAHHNYDGMNVYGDEVTTNIFSVGQSMVAGGLLPPSLANLLPRENVSRTGYNETDLTANKASNTKFDLSLHYKPFANDIEVIWQSKFGYGNAIYQGANRYNLNNFFMEQHKIEVTGKNFFVRGYTTTEDGGDSYDMLFTGINVNRKWKPDATWFGQYAGAYSQAFAGLFGPTYAGNATASHAFARGFAQTGALVPGTPAFQKAFDQVTADPSVLTGSKLVDNSSVYHSDVNYNFKDIIKFAEIQVGGSYRLYALNSHGRIYTDADEPINYNEYGAYTQIQKKFMDDRLKFTGSLRYDKAKNYEGHYSPRVSLVYSAGDNKQHNFRTSFQTGFRNPNTQDQYIGFDVGSAVLVGSAPDNLLRFKETRNVLTPTGQFLAGGTTKVMTGVNAYNNSYTLSSVLAFAAQAPVIGVAGAALLLRKTTAELVKPEDVKAFDLGYRGQISKVSLDLNGYYNYYNNFIGQVRAVAPLYGTAINSPGPTDITLHAISTGNTRVYQLYTNTKLEIESYGIGVGIGTKVFGNYDLTANYNYAEFKFDLAKAEPGFESSFNTPKHRVKVSFGNESLFQNFGIHISGRWNDEYKWESTMADGMIAATTVIDAQINYALPKWKALFKIGAANLGGKEYGQVLGAGAIGSQYYASWTFKP